jgi:hypothetical protein
MYVKGAGLQRPQPPVNDREDSMTRFNPHRDAFNPTKNSKFLAIFWACLVTLYVLSYWP